MEIIVCGAAGGHVTGSAYLVRTKYAQICIDFGMFQGSDELEESNRIPPQLDIERLDAVVLTHAHLDHTGRLPLLAKGGYAKPIFCTQATAMMAELILKDAAKLQEADAERHNRKNPNRPPVKPIFDAGDVAELNRLYKHLPYNSPLTVAKGITVRAREAGHMLGSVSLEVTIEEDSNKKVVVFSGDLGPRHAPILKEALTFEKADLVFLESTYGDRDHRPFLDTVAEARQIIASAVQKRGKILIPVFAVGRAQLLLYILAGSFNRGTLPRFPIYLDSPMAIRATEIYRENIELFDDEASASFESGELSRNLQSVMTCETADDSRSLNDRPGPLMILAGSGMCNGGRIMHHLRHNLSSPTTVVMIVGYQSEGSLGRKLVDGEKLVRIFGEEVEVRAEVHTLNGFSAHAGQSDLLKWVDLMARQKPRIALTHGEDRGRIGLSAKIKQSYQVECILPRLGEVISL